MRLIIVMIIAAAGFASADFLDDFESYSQGEDPEVSPDWDREPSGGYTNVIGQGENQVLKAFFPDSAYIGYLCQGAGFWTDGSVSMDFSPIGNGSFSNVFARMQLMTGEAYVGGVTLYIQPISYAYIAYVNVSGDYELLYSGMGPGIIPGNWVNVKLEVEGTDPVTLTLYTNGVQAAQVTDTVHCLDSGLSGFALFYEASSPQQMYSDNFEVVFSPQSLQAMTFAAVKAVFQ